MTSGRKPGRKASPRATFDAAFAGVKPNLKLPDLVMPGTKAKTPKKQHQAEFGSPGSYFAEKTIGAVTSGGRARASQIRQDTCSDRKALRRAGRRGARHLGPRIRLRRAKMPYDAFEVLGTKAFMSTRKDMFRMEVLAALEIVERGLVTAAR